MVLTSDSLFAADTGKLCIYRFNANGELELMFRHDSVHFFLEPKGTFYGSLPGFVVYASPITMTFSPADGLLYIANPGRHRVDVFTQDGLYQPELGWGEPSGSLSGFVGCCNPIGLAALDDGRILTVEKAISRIKIFREGKLDCVVAGPGILEEVPNNSERHPAEPGGRYFTAVPLSSGEIAVFDYEYAVVRVFSL